MCVYIFFACGFKMKNAAKQNISILTFFFLKHSVKVIFEEFYILANKDIAPML